MIAKCTAMVQYGDIGRNHHFMELDVISLRRTYTELKRSLHCTVDAHDYALLMPTIHSFKRLSDLENRCVSWYDINRSSFLFKVERHMQLLGAAEAATRRPLSSEQYHQLIHPDDLPFLYDAEIRMYHYLQQHRHRMQDFKLVYDYRVRRLDDSHYIRFLHQMAVFACDRDGNAWIIVILSDVLEYFSDDALPRRFLIDTTNGHVCMFQEELGFTDWIITPREREVLTLIAQGLDSEAIAERLCISLHTVNNHRQNILRRTRSHHIAQATLYMKCLGLI